MERVRNGTIELAAHVAGADTRPSILLLHGWPHDGTLYRSVLDLLGEQFFAIAFDLPAIGESTGLPPSAEKHRLAAYLLDAAEALGATRPLVGGIDVGGMIAFAAARDQGDRIAGAAVGNTAIPGIEPWHEIERDPRIFHFALHAVPDLPELLVTGHQRAYFDFFFDALGNKKKPLPESVRADFAAAYTRPDALRAGFDWYRAFAADAEHNSATRSISTPILYFRGDADGRGPDDYVAGLKAAGAERVVGRGLPGTAEFAPVEAPEMFVKMIGEFAEQCQTR